jgi:hypothetical protein
MNKKISIKAFVDIFDELSSVELQVKLWLNIENDTGLISSFVELMNNIDSPDFSYVIDEIVQDSELKEELNELLSMVGLYEEPKIYRKYKNDVYIVADPNWKKIRDFAKSIKVKYYDYLRRVEKNI